MPDKIDVTVAAVIEREDKYLIVEERVAGEHVFNQPAGHLEPGESLLEAVVREVGEETGFAFTPEALIGVSLWRAPDRTYLRVTFSGAAKAPAVTPQLDIGIIATHWLPRHELLKKNLRSPLVMQSVDAYLSGARYPLELLATLLPEPESIAKRA